jgi:hypothetical protein
VGPGRCCCSWFCVCAFLVPSVSPNSHRPLPAPPRPTAPTFPRRRASSCSGPPSLLSSALARVLSSFSFRLHTSDFFLTNVRAAEELLVVCHFLTLPSEPRLQTLRLSRLSSHCLLHPPPNGTRATQHQRPPQDPLNLTHVTSISSHQRTHRQASQRLCLLASCARPP